MTHSEIEDRLDVLSALQAAVLTQLARQSGDPALFVEQCKEDIRQCYWNLPDVERLVTGADGLLSTVVRALGDSDSSTRH